MTNLQKLLIQERELTALQEQVNEAERVHVDPVKIELQKAGERANVLWLAVLDEFGPGEAQRQLYAARQRAQAR